MRYLVVGAGISGASVANLLANQNDSVVVIDKREHIAGNCYDYRDNGIMIHKYGSHIFHTNDESIWRFVNKFGEFNTYMHKVIGLIDGIHTNIPFNFNTLYDVFPPLLAQKLESKLLAKFEFNTKVPILEFQKQDDEDLEFLAKYIYDKIFLHYTNKQWGSTPNDMALATARVPIYLSKDNRYFQDKYQGIPRAGYTNLIAKMLEHKNIEVRLNTNYKNLDLSRYGAVIITSSIDEYFDYKYGELPYRSVEFALETHETEFYQQNAVINYPCNYDFTRIHEYKHYLNDKSSATIIAKEYSSSFSSHNPKSDRYYPIQTQANMELYDKYLSESKKIKDVYFLGRLGDYQYYDMDKAVKRAMDFVDKLKEIDNV